MMMRKDFLAGIAAMMSLVLVMSSCENNSQKNPGDSFVGKYNYVSSGQVDLYAGALKFSSLPMDNEGELSIVPADEPNTVHVIVENDTTIGHISGEYLFMDPIEATQTFGELEMTLSFTYTKATLRNDSLTFKTNVDVKAIFKDYDLSGKGEVDVIAMRQTSELPIDK